MSESMSFSQLALPEPILRAVLELGYEHPSPIQEAAIPKLLAGEDLLGQKPKPVLVKQLRSHCLY